MQSFIYAMWPCCIQSFTSRCSMTLSSPPPDLFSTCCACHASYSVNPLCHLHDDSGSYPFVAGEQHNVHSSLGKGSSSYPFRKSLAHFHSLSFPAIFLRYPCRSHVQSQNQHFTQCTWTPLNFGCSIWLDARRSSAYSDNFQMHILLCTVQAGSGNVHQIE